MRSLLALAAALLAAGCTTVAPAIYQVHPETLPNCTRACAQVGMKVAAIVFVQNYGGCVCQPSGAVGQAPAGEGAALSGAMVVIDAAQQQSQQQQSQHRSPTPTPYTAPHR